MYSDHEKGPIRPELSVCHWQALKTEMKNGVHPLMVFLRCINVSGNKARNNTSEPAARVSSPWMAH